METAQQISPISQDQLPPKIGDFQHATLGLLVQRDPAALGGRESGVVG
jgi:hypothetical protein